jgi:hypothetical protein
MACLGVLAAWIALRGVGLYMGLSENQDSHAPPGWVSLTTTAALVIAGWANVLEFRRTRLKWKALLIALGITCGFCGDCSLAAAAIMTPQQRFVAGMLFFGAGHVAYLGAMLKFAHGLAPHVRRKIFGAWAVILVPCLYGWSILIYRSEVPLGTVVWWIFAYTFLLTSTAGVGVGVTLAKLRLWPLAIGGLLFVVSDAFIVLRLFNPALDAVVRTATSSDWTWLAYSPAQLCIVFTLPWLTATAIRRQRRHRYPRFNEKGAA